jgi:hypothetical protein
MTDPKPSPASKAAPKTQPTQSAHRQHGQVATKDSSWPITAALAIIVLLGLYGLAARWDEYSEMEQAYIEAQMRNATELGELERDWSARVASAYAQGQRDAMRVIETRPQGVELAQACQAWAHRNQIPTSRSALASATVNQCPGA